MTVSWEELQSYHTCLVQSAKDREGLGGGPGGSGWQGCATHELTGVRGCVREGQVE